LNDKFKDSKIQDSRFKDLPADRRKVYLLKVGRFKDSMNQRFDVG